PRRNTGSAQGPLSHARLLSADRRHRIRGRHPAGDHSGNAALHHLRAPGSRHRSRFRGVHGAQKTGGLFLMAHQSVLIAEDIEKCRSAQEQRGLLRFMTGGSVDDGKSTLIGRLLYESKLVFADHLAALEADSKKATVNRPDGELDLALLVDGLAAEREQG